MRMVGIDEMRKMEPALSADLLGGYYCPVDGGVNSLNLTRALAKHAKRLGARIYTGCEVHDIQVSKGRIEGVVTNRMTIATRVVVDAAGIHTSQIAAMVGMEVPVFPERGQLTITEALPRLIHRTVGSYKQFENGQFLLGVSNELVGENTRVTTEIITSRIRVATQILPPLKAVRAARCAAALRPMTPDRLPIFEKLQGLSDFYVTVGHSGITLAPVTGKALTDLITQGRTDLPISGYSTERFKETQGSRSKGS
jgi:sarcosine oxidase subunit beta